MTDWNEVTLTLRYRDEALTPGGESRCEPSTVEQMVVEIDRQMNASHFGGLIEVRMMGGGKSIIERLGALEAAQSEPVQVVIGDTVKRQPFCTTHTRRLSDEEVDAKLESLITERDGLKHRLKEVDEECDAACRERDAERRHRETLSKQCRDLEGNHMESFLAFIAAMGFTTTICGDGTIELRPKRA